MPICNIFRAVYDASGNVTACYVQQPWLFEQKIERRIVELCDPRWMRLDETGLLVTVGNGWAKYRLSGSPEDDVFELELIESAYEEAA